MRASIPDGNILTHAHKTGAPAPSATKAMSEDATAALKKRPSESQCSNSRVGWEEQSAQGQLWRAGASGRFLGFFGLLGAWNPHILCILEAPPGSHEPRLPRILRKAREHHHGHVVWAGGSLHANTALRITLLR